MSAKNKIQIQNINNSSEGASTVDVLYQKMGDRWYAFTQMGEEVFVGSLTEEEILAASATEHPIEKLIEVA